MIGMEMTASELEEQAREKVSDSLSAIEVALSEWEAAKSKPNSLAGRISYLKISYKLLSYWERESLKGKKDDTSVIKRMRSFTAMCEKLETAKGGKRD
jgi:hypothetical protein